MSRSRRTLATVVVAALSSWSCSSTAPDATPEVAAIVVSPAISTLALNSQLPLQVQVQDGSGAIVPDAVITWTVQDPAIVSISESGVVTAVGSSDVGCHWRSPQARHHVARRRRNPAYGMPMTPSLANRD